MAPPSPTTWNKLLEASQDGNLPALEGLIQYLDWAEPVEENAEDMGSLLSAAAKGARDDALSLLLDHGAQVDALSPAGWTALRVSVFEGHVSTAKLLLQFGAIAEPEALYLALSQAHAPCVDLLLSHGADPDAQVPGTGRTSREFAQCYVDSGQPRFKAIMERMNRPRLKSEPANPTLGNQALALLKSLSVGDSAKQAYMSLVEMSRSIDLHLVDEAGNSPVMLLVKNQVLPVPDLCTLTQALLENGADPNHVNHVGKSALYFAVMARRAEMIELLVHYGADLEQSFNGGRTALSLTLLPSYLAGAHTAGEALQDTVHLLRLGANPNHPDADGNTALHIAAGCYEHRPPSKTVRGLGAPVRTAASPFQLGSRKGGSGLSSRGMPASAQSASPRFTVQQRQQSQGCVNQQSLLSDSSLQLSLLEELLKHGASPNQPNNQGATALVHACENLRVEAVEMLCEAGASVTQVIEPQSEQCVLHHAAGIGEVAVVATLVRFMESPLVLDARACTPLHAACDGAGDPEAVTLLSSLMPCTAVDDAGMTALHTAARRGHSEAIRVLINNGAHIEAADAKGCTALAVAAYCGHAEACSTLVALGALVDTKDANQLSPLQYACLSAWDSLQALPVLVAAPGVQLDACAGGSPPPLQILLEQTLPAAPSGSPSKLEAVSVRAKQHEHIQEAILLLLKAGASPTAALDALLQETSSGVLQPDRVHTLNLLIAELVNRGACPHKLPALVRACTGNSNFEALADQLLTVGANPRLDLDLQHSVYLEVAELVITCSVSLERAEELFLWLRSRGCKAAGTGNGFELQSSAWFTALHRATMLLEGDLIQPLERSLLVRLLITKAYADVNAPDSTGQTPLQSAVQHRNHAAARVLLEFCADPNAAGGVRAAKSARGSPSPRAGSRIPRRGAREPVRPQHTMMGMVEQQAAATALQDQLTGVGAPPLKMAAVQDDHEMVRLLLEHKALPEVQDEWGKLSRSVLSLLREFGGKVAKEETELPSSTQASTETELSPFLDRLRQMSQDRLLLEAHVSPSKPLGGLSPEGSARAYTRQLELLQQASKIKQEQVMLEQAEQDACAWRAEREAREPSQRAMTDIEEMLAARGTAVGTTAIRHELHEHELADEQQQEMEAAEKYVQAAEAAARQDLKDESWADKEISAMLNRRNRVKKY